MAEMNTKAMYINLGACHYEHFVNNIKVISNVLFTSDV